MLIEADFKPGPAHSQAYILYATLYYALLFYTDIGAQRWRESMCMRKRRMS